MGRRLDRELDALESHLVWIVGSPRAGTTWLLNMLAGHHSIRILDEPLIGAHLGMPATVPVGPAVRSPRTGDGARALDVFRHRPDYFFSDRYAPTWREPLRRLLLLRLREQLRDGGGDARRNTLLVKEPHGSEAADLLVETLPRCRLLVLARDGRDVVDSTLDAVRTGAWAAGLATLEEGPEARRRFIEDSAWLWVERMRVVLDVHGHGDGRHLLLRYEDLLGDPQRHVTDVLRWLGVVDDPCIAGHVERLAFDRVDEQERGPGKFHRAATPGLWREHFSPAERAVVDDIMASTLQALGYPID